MKRELRNILVTMSAVAVAAGCTSFFTGCSKNTDVEEKKDNDNNGIEENENEHKAEPRVQPVNDDNLQEMINKKDQSGRQSNAYNFSYRVNKNKIDALIDSEGLEDTKKVVLDSFKLYKKADGHYYVIDKDKAFELVEADDGGYTFLKDVNGYTVLTDTNGSRTLVFGGEEAYNSFIEEMKEKFEANEGSVCTVIDGIFVGDPIDKKTVDCYDGTRDYYDLEAVLRECDKAISKFDCFDPITYGKSQDDGSYNVIRTAYELVSNNGVDEVVANEQVVNIPIGEKGLVYYDNDVNSMIGMTFEEDDKTWISADALMSLIGINVVEGEYTIPGTEDAYKALMIDTAGGVDEPKFAIQPTIKEEAPVVSAEEPQPDTTPQVVVEEPEQQINNTPIYIEGDYSKFEGVEEVNPFNDDNDGSEDYDPVLHDLGIDIVLTGTPAEQAIQYGQALESVFPGHINYGEGSCSPFPNQDEVHRLESSYTYEELVNMYNEWLAGRNIEDIPDSELFDHLELASAAFDPAGVGAYLVDKYSRTFADGHIVSW